MGVHALAKPDREQILAGLDVISEFKQLGIEFTGKKFPSGWHECHAYEREDETPSAGVNPVTGMYKSHHGHSISLFDLAAEKGLCGKNESLLYYAAKAAGVHTPTIEKAASKQKKPSKPKDQGTLEATYFYTDENSNPVLKVLKYRLANGKKSFPQFKYEGNGKWSSGVKDVVRVPYCLPRVLESKSVDATIIIVEGEKDADTLHRLGTWTETGFIATTVPEGAKEKAVNPHLKCLVGPCTDRDVVVIADNDTAGQNHAEATCSILYGVAKSVRLIPAASLPGPKVGPKGDVSDWIELGGTLDDLRLICEHAPEWQPTVALPSVVASRAAATAVMVGERPKILVCADMKRVIDEAEQSLQLEPNLFHRANMLVRVVPSEGTSSKYQPNRPTGTPLIFPVEDATLAEMMASHADWKKLVFKDDEAEERATIPPSWAVRGLAARKTWPGLRPLTGIIETPTIRVDGSVLETPGWDSSTGLLYSPSIEFPPVPDSPTHEDAKRAAGTLLDLVCDVPFKTPKHGAAWLAGLLTVIARHAIDGPTPMFVFSANIRSTGKSLLCDLIYAIAAGREMPRKSIPANEEEFGKVVLAIAMSGDAVTMFDNIPSGTPIGGAKLDNVLTATTIKERLLGTNTEPILPWRTILFATGNNLSVKADTFSRTCWSLIESEEVRPEERRDFKVKGCLVKHAKSRRPELVEAALTILRAHAVANRPHTDDLPPVRSNYRSWSDVIRSAVYWATGLDPCEVPEDERAIDQDAEAVDTLVSGWKAICESQNAPALRASEVLDILRLAPNDQHEGLRELFLSWSRDSDLPSPRSVGKRLAQFKKRPSRFGSLDETPKIAGFTKWFVREPKKSPTGDRAGAFEAFEAFVSAPPRVNPESRITTEVVRTENYTEQGGSNASNALNAPQAILAYPFAQQEAWGKLAFEIEEREGVSRSEAENRAFRQLTGNDPATV